MLEHLGIVTEIQEKTVEKICNENKISTDLFLTIANLFNGFKTSSETDYAYNDIQAIIKYLNNSHKYYLEEKYPQIRQYIEEINTLNRHPEIKMIGKFFEKYFMEVTEHLDYEDDVVFPYVLNLNNLIAQNITENNISNYSVTQYREHHNDIEEKLTDLKNLLIKYIPQKEDQQIRRKLILCLLELEYDLNIHAQVEESILIPLVEKMERLAKNMSIRK
jgi:regulator of cell morphogenesis and NO signaling